MCIIHFGTLDNTFSFYIGSSDWHHEVFLLPTKRRVSGPPLIKLFCGTSTLMLVRGLFASCVFALHAPMPSSVAVLQALIISPPISGFWATSAFGFSSCVWSSHVFWPQSQWNLGLWSLQRLSIFFPRGLQYSLHFPPPPCNPPPRGGGRPSLHCFAGQHLLQWFVFPICRMHVLALLSHHFKSVTCVYSVIFSLQRRCAGCHVPVLDPRCFLPVTVYGTTHAHLVHMCWPLLWGLHQMGHSFCHRWYIRPGGVTQECSTLKDRGCGGCITQVFRVAGHYPHRFAIPNAGTAHTARFTCVLFACISGGYHSLPWKTLAISPPPLRGETVIWRPSPPPPKGETVACYGGRFQGRGGYHLCKCNFFQHMGLFGFLQSVRTPRFCAHLLTI